MVFMSCLDTFQTGQGDGALLSLSDAVSRAAKTAGVKPVTPSDSLQEELESEELQEAYAEQVHPVTITFSQLRLIVTHVVF